MPATTLPRPNSRVARREESTARTSPLTRDPLADRLGVKGALRREAEPPVIKADLYAFYYYMGSVILSVLVLIGFALSLWS